MRRFYVVTGGTMVHIAPHFALCAPAFGQVGAEIARGLGALDLSVTLVRTRMALGGASPSDEEATLYSGAGIRRLETNEDLRALLDHLVALPDTRAIVLAAAVCDWEPEHLSIAGASVESFGKDVERLTSSAGSIALRLRTSDKLLARVRRHRKDIFLVAFKATAGKRREETYAAGLALLKRASANLVLANDVNEHHNVVITPEEFPYYAASREEAVSTLCEMVRDRSGLDFVRTIVRDEERANVIELHERGAIPSNFVPVLRALIARGAYKPFLGRTTGHFGCLVLDEALPYRRISSVRKVDHNRVLEEGMARIYGHEDGRIVAGGAKPSVGEHTQGRIYEELDGKVHSIVHFHSPTRRSEGVVPVATQRPFECGSVQCAENTATHMIEVSPGIYAVQLEGHGPNIAFHRDVDSERVLAFIEEHFDLAEKTGGILPSTV